MIHGWRKHVGIYLAGILSLGWMGWATAGPVQLQASDLVAVCGDSITEQKDYSVNIEAYLLMCGASGPVRTIQFGWSGDSMGWLFGRGSQNHILAVSPTVITTCYGMNDGGYKPVTPETVQKYRDGMTNLVKAFKDSGARVVVGSPGCVDSDSWHKNPKDAAMYNQTLAALRDAAKEVALAEDCAFANVYDVMFSTMGKAKAKYGPQYTVAGGDGVHPAANGHLIMAYAFLKALGCDGNIGTISVDMAGGKATASEGHRVLSAKDGVVELESSRYPFCFSGKADEPAATTGIIEFFPFNQDLNRLQLQVTGLKAQKARITWGKTSKEFSATELAQGINLAAEFLDNPFCESFQKIRAGIRTKQEFETTLYKVALANFPLMTKMIAEDDPKAAAALDGVKDALIRKDAKLAEALKTQVMPVKHTIKIEEVK